LPDFVAATQQSVVQPPNFLLPFARSRLCNCEAPGLLFLEYAIDLF